MKTLPLIIAIIATIFIFACLDSILTYVLKDASIVRLYMTRQGEFTLLWFYGGDIMQNIYNKLTKDDK